MYRDNPFGNPDGARADLREIEYSFITEFPYGLNFDKNQNGILNKRVIVGAKGSGKTVYLRKIHSMLKRRAEENPSIYVEDSIDQNLNCTDRVIAFCDLYSKSLLSEKWSKIWEISILLSIVNRLYVSQQLANHISDEERKLLLSLVLDECKILKDTDFIKEHLSIYSFFQILLSEAITKASMNDILSGKNWLRLRARLEQTLRNLPEMYFFLDSIDLEYEHAPLHWLMCQKGLFYSLFSFLQEPIWGEKLHLIITLRDNVFTSILTSEHSTKFANESHIFLLNWDEQNIGYFLSQKIRNLSDCYFIKEDFKEKNIESWLNTRVIQNEYNKEEGVAQFIIRHTRLVPRDIINICNELAKLHLEAKNIPEINIKNRIKEIVISHSRAIGEELITICAKNITANSMPSHAGKQDYSEGFTANQYYHENTYTKVLNILSNIQSNEITRKQLEALDASADTVFEKPSYFSDVLWQNGVIGFIENTKNVFYAQRFKGDPLLPKKEKYIVRSCIEQKLNITVQAGGE